MDGNQGWIIDNSTGSLFVKSEHGTFRAENISKLYSSQFSDTLLGSEVGDKFNLVAGGTHVVTGNGGSDRFRVSNKQNNYEFGDKYEAEALEQELNRAYVHRIDFVHEYQSKNSVSIQPQICKWAGAGNEVWAKNEVFELSLEGTPLLRVQLPEVPADIKANLDAEYRMV